MRLRILTVAIVLGAVLLLVGPAPLPAGPALAQQPQPLTIYFYRDGQAVAIARAGTLSGDPQADAERLLAELLAGPTPGERSSGLISPLPPGTTLIAVTVSGPEIVADLSIPLDFLRNDLDPYLSDAIVEQIVKTVHPLGLHHVRVRTENEEGVLVPVSDFLPRPAVPVPVIPPNDDPVPDLPGPAPAYVGQPPAFGQGQPLGTLTGTSVWLSAGHGWYYEDALSRWTTQRGNNYGIVEDFSNAEAVNYYLARYLWNAGADVWLVRERAMTNHEIIVDNDVGAPAYTETGSWSTSTSPGYEGGTYRWANTNSTLSASATWSPDLPEAGWYPVWVWYRHGSNRPTDARYEIHHAGGTTTVSLSQEVHGQTWRYLGEFYFEAGMGGHVTLVNTSAEATQAVIADAVRFGGGLGSIEDGGTTSGRPRWEEGAKYWARYQGAPPEASTYDVVSRPLYAEWESAKGYPGEAENAVYISWHTNAANASGTESYIHSTEPTTGSVELQDWVHAELIADLRAAWDPTWVNRGQKSANYGELRELSIIPGVLLEVAFHDTEDPGDADDLKEPVFRQIAARAVFQGIVKYQAERLGKTARLLPEPPERLAARTTGPGEVTLTWAPPPCCNGVVGDAASAYKVYHSASGRAFDDGTATSDPNLTLTGLPAGSLHFFRVTALNEGGESFPSPVVAVRTPAGGQAVDFLIVDGFDRLDKEAMIPQYEAPFLGTAQRMFLERMHRYDYAVEHGQALEACGLSFDGAVNEAVEAGDLALGGYRAVDWFTGEDSTADASLSDTERALLAAYLDGGGRLLISGSELGYDLVEYGRDPAFYRDYLRADYVGDDAGTYHFAGVAGGILNGLAGSFDDSTGGTYDVGYPDRMASPAGSTLVLTYAGGLSPADGAAVTYAGDFRVVHFGFPLETVTDPATRASLFCNAAGYLLPASGPDLTLSPDRSGETYPGQTVVYTHTLTNLGSQTDVFSLTHTSSQGWAVDYTAAITLDGSLAATLAVSITPPAGVPSGTVDTTVLTATSQTDPAAQAAVTDRTTVIEEPPLPTATHPRLINPGFEQGLIQFAWQAADSGGGPVLAHAQDLPAPVTPYEGNWVAWLGSPSAGVASTTILTQVVALPSGEPAASLDLAWYVHPQAATLSAGDRLSAGIYDLSGALQTELFTLGDGSAAGTWQAGTFDLSAFAGETIQLAFRATASETAFFLDDVQLRTGGPSSPQEFRALWVDAYYRGIKGRLQINELVETAQAGSFNALVVQVRRRGDTFYPSALDPWAPDAVPDFDALAYLVERAHAAGIEVHAWATTLAIWGGDTPPIAPDHTFYEHGPGTEGRDYWLMTSYSGEEKPGDLLYYLDPGHPDAVDYTVAIYAELATQYDLDGVHLDRIRYPEHKGTYCQDQIWFCQDWGYNPVSVARFQAQTGRDDLPEPLDAEWVQWRRDQITALVRKVYLVVTAIDPQMRVSAATVTSGGSPSDLYPWETRTPYIHHLQDWRGWLEEGILDLALPMTYRDEDTYAGQFDGWIEWQKDHQYGRGTATGSGLYLNAVSDSMAQWTRVRQPSATGNHVQGMLGFSYANPSDEGVSGRGFANAAVTEVFTRSTSTPPLPWKDTPVLGHLSGRLTQTPSCRILDGYPLSLTGPASHTLYADGSGWFGAVDLPPGEYQVAVDVVSPTITIETPVTVVAGTVAEPEILLPACAPYRRYLPLVMSK